MNAAETVGLVSEEGKNDHLPYMRERDKEVKRNKSSG